MVPIVAIEASKSVIEGKMDKEYAVSYGQFYSKPVKERVEIFNEISAENRAFLVKTQAERWLAANRSRLTDEQIATIEEMNRSISPEWYRESREDIDPGIEALFKKVEAVLSREDMRELATKHAQYIPFADDEIG